MKKIIIKNAFHALFVLLFLTMLTTIGMEQQKPLFARLEAFDDSSSAFYLNSIVRKRISNLLKRSYAQNEPFVCVKGTGHIETNHDPIALAELEEMGIGTAEDIKQKLDQFVQSSYTPMILPVSSFHGKKHGDEVFRETDSNGQVKHWIYHDTPAMPLAIKIQSDMVQFKNTPQFMSYPNDPNPLQEPLTNQLLAFNHLGLLTHGIYGYYALMPLNTAAEKQPLLMNNTQKILTQKLNH